jgi:DNA (cytosine-5)-methyltransferase 1
MPAYYNDIDQYCCQVLRKNVQQGNLPEGTVDERDIRELHATDFMGYNHVHLFCGIGGFPLGLKWAGFPQSMRVLTGGFPCQDISIAGKRAGITGERSGLWKHMYRLIQEAIDCNMAFDYIFVENVAALVTWGLSTVLGDLAQAGYDAEWQCLRASDVGAPHLRERIFIVAYPNKLRESREISTLSNGERSAIESTGIRQWEDTESLAYTQRLHSVERAFTTKKRRRQKETEQVGMGSLNAENTSSQGWASIGNGISTGQDNTISSPSRNSAEGTTQSFMGRMFNGLSRRLDRLRWPALPGEEQHEWEPSRIVTGKSKYRVARLKSLGNAIVPQLVAEIGRAVMEQEGLV